MIRGCLESEPFDVLPFPCLDVLQRFGPDVECLRRRREQRHRQCHRFQRVAYLITGSGTVIQTTRTTAQQSLEVTRVYAITAQVVGNTVPQLYTDVSTYDILWTTTAADSFSAQFLNLPDTSTVAATRSFRLSPTGQLLPLTDEFTTVTSVQTPLGPLSFNAAIRVGY